MFTAVFYNTNCTINFNVGTGGSASQSSVEVAYGQSFSYQANAPFNGSIIFSDGQTVSLTSETGYEVSDVKIGATSIIGDETS